MNPNALRKQRLQIHAALLGLFVLVTGLCLLPLVAFAADAVVAPTTPAQTPLQAALMPILSTLGLVIATFVGAGVKKLASIFEKKFNVDIPDALEESMARQARRLVAAAEEKAEKRLLYGDKKDTPGAEKAAMVITSLGDYAKRLGYGPEWQKERIENLVDGVLHIDRDVVIGTPASISPERSAALKAALNGK
jgi:hypothetical protein